VVLKKWSAAVKKGSESLEKGREALEKHREALGKGSEAVEIVREALEIAREAVDLARAALKLAREALEKHREAVEKGREAASAASPAGAEADLAGAAAVATLAAGSFPVPLAPATAGEWKGETAAPNPGKAAASFACVGRFMGNDSVHYTVTACAYQRHGVHGRGNTSHRCPAHGNPEPKAESLKLQKAKVGTGDSLSP